MTRRENDYSGFYATVLQENKSMSHVFLKRFPDAKVKACGSENETVMEFS